MTTELRCRAVLFDIDGTLLDAFAAAERCWATWARSVGVDGEGIIRGDNHGRPRPDIVRSVLPDADEPDVARHVERVRLLERDDNEGTFALDGAHALLASLPEGRWGVVTSNDAEGARNRLAAAALPMPTVLVTSDDVERGKPHPDCFLLAARALGAEPMDVVVVEDAPAGLEAAHRAGMRAIAVRHTAESDDVLHRAEHIVDNPAALRVRVEGDELVITVLAVP